MAKVLDKFDDRAATVRCRNESDYYHCHISDTSQGYEEFDVDSVYITAKTRTRSPKKRIVDEPIEGFGTKIDSEWDFQFRAFNCHVLDKNSTEKTIVCGQGLGWTAATENWME